MIILEQKKEEYREMIEYWISRFIDGDERHYSASLFKSLGYEPTFKDFDIVRFRNGYQKDSPTFDIEFKGIEITTGNPEWGAEPGQKYFVIKLGDVIKDEKYFDALGKLDLVPSE